MRTRKPASSLIAAALALAGCDRTGGSNAGLTNGPPPEAGEKSAQRSDLPPSASADRAEPVGTLGDTRHNAGTGGQGGGNAGGQGANPGNNPSANPDTVRANPPIRSGGDPHTAAGGTKPAEPIQQGTPRSPQ